MKKRIVKIDLDNTVEALQKAQSIIDAVAMLDAICDNNIHPPTMTYRRRSKRVICPTCEKKFSPQGLGSHYRANPTHKVQI